MTAAGQSAPERIEFRWVFPPNQGERADEVLDRLRSEGGDVELEPQPPTAIAFIPIIAGAIAVVALAKAIKSFWDDNKPGVLIDARTDGPPKITEEDNLPTGVVVVLKKDGSVQIEQPDAGGLKELIEAAKAA